MKQLIVHPEAVRPHDHPDHELLGIGKTIQTNEQLWSFRRYWSGRRVAELIAKSDQPILIDWAVGVGKSHNLDDLVEVVVEGNQYHLVVVLSPTWDVINERRWVKEPPAGIKVTLLRPRPKKDCGDLNDKWEIFETNHLGALGRDMLCRKCRRYENCFWPSQYGQSLQGSQVIFGTQAHLERDSRFIARLGHWCGADKVLLIIDEANFLLQRRRRTIERHHLGRYLQVLSMLAAQSQSAALGRQIEVVESLLRVDADGLRDLDRRIQPANHGLALKIQRLGYETFGDEFKFIGYELEQLGLASSGYLWRESNGDIGFISQPYLNVDLVIYSGTHFSNLLSLRLNAKISRPFAHYRFNHPDTQWYNIASRSGMKKYFSSHSEQILDFFACLVARRLKAGKRPLLICKKCFKEDCARQMEARLRDLGVDQPRVVTGNWALTDLSTPNVVPLITYGIVGVNLFEEFNAAYCLTGYYVNQVVVNTIIKEIEPTLTNESFRITTDTDPLRRRIRLTDGLRSHLDPESVVQMVLDQYELEQVLQAVGRVRPYTKPREIITFQCAEHPTLAYTQEFNSLEEARRHFQIDNPRRRGQRANQQRVREARQRGLTQRQATLELGLGLRTVQRYWRVNQSP